MAERTIAGKDDAGVDKMIFNKIRELKDAGKKIGITFSTFDFEVDDSQSCGFVKTQAGYSTFVEEN